MAQSKLCGNGLCVWKVVLSELAKSTYYSVLPPISRLPVLVFLYYIRSTLLLISSFYYVIKCVEWTRGVYRWQIFYQDITMLSKSYPD